MTKLTKADKKAFDKWLREHLLLNESTFALASSAFYAGVQQGQHEVTIKHDKEDLRNHFAGCVISGILAGRPDMTHISDFELAAVWNITDRLCEGAKVLKPGTLVEEKK